jgi:outer membrane scaffolding protein for murein synthesis (MipA/OmpV family)
MIRPYEKLHYRPFSLILWLTLPFLLFFFQTGYGNARENPADQAPPLWEVGLFPGAIRMPHYRGSDEYTLWAMPLPYVIYRGDILQLDREGFQGIFKRSAHWEASISGWGNPPVDEDNKAREGMDELDPVIEAGPSLKWYFTGRNPDRELYLKWALRGVASVGVPDDLHTAWRGVKSAINLVWVLDAPFGRRNWEASANAGLEAADSTYHRYFYAVEPADALPDRPVYRPEKGFSGLTLSGRLIYAMTDRLSLAGYSRWENVSWAAYTDSPLVKEENNFIVGVALVWTLITSEARARK